MKNLQTSIRKHKKLFCVLGLVFIVCMECCVFPVGRVPLGGDRISVFINIYTAIIISKCVSEIEVTIFPKATWLLILLLNFGITIMGMAARYLLEYGEVSNFAMEMTGNSVNIYTIIRGFIVVGACDVAIENLCKKDTGKGEIKGEKK